MVSLVKSLTGYHQIGEVSVIGAEALTGMILDEFVVIFNFLLALLLQNMKLVEGLNQHRVVIGAVGFFVVGPIAELLGARGEMLELCIVYARIILAALPFFMLQIAFQAFMIVAERPNLGFIFTVIAGVTNIVLDALLVAVFDLGLVGAAAYLYMFLTKIRLLKAEKSTFSGASAICYFALLLCSLTEPGIFSPIPCATLITFAFIMLETKEKKDV